MASNESALIPGEWQTGRNTGGEWNAGQWNTGEWDTAGWDTAEWNLAAGWTPPVTEQTPPTKGAVDSWDTSEWDMRAAWMSMPPPVQSTDEPKVATERTATIATEPAAATPGDDSTAESADAENPATRTSVWNPLAETADPFRGRHRVAKPRTRARGSAVFGVAAVAVLGVGGVASAEGHGPGSLSLPDLPEVSDMPGIGTIVADITGSGGSTPAKAPFDTGAGEALRARILDQANQQRSAAVEAKRDAAAAKAAKEAAATKVREQAAAKKKAAAEAANRKAAAEAARLARSFVKPVSSYTLTAGFGETSSLWVNAHTGQDFAAPTGTPVVAIHGGTITSAGWAGSYGYRIIMTLDDGTEIWYCHLSSMTVTSGKVTTGETIGRVGATGNVTGPHLHLEVRPDSGSPIDPMPWLRARGLTV